MKRLKISILCCLLVSLFCVMSVNASVTSSGGKEKVNDVKIAAWDLEAFGEEINTVYKTARAISVPIAAVALAYNALMILLGSTKEMEMYKTRIKLLLIAIIAVCFIPLAVNLGADLASSYAWDPASPGIVTDVSGGADTSGDVDSSDGADTSGDADSSGD